MNSSFDSSSDQESVEELQKVKRVNEQLKHANDNLYQELTTLRAEYKSESENLKNLKSIQDENQRLLEINKKLMNEKEELAQKIEEDRQIIEDLQNTNNNDKQDNFQTNEQHQSDKQHQSDMQIPQTPDGATSESVSASPNTMKRHLHNALDDNKKLVDNIDELQYQYEMQVDTNNVVLEAFSQYFNIDFQTIDELLNYVAKQDSFSAASHQSDKESIKKLLVSNKKLSEKMKNEKRSKNSLQSELHKLKRQMNAERKKQESKVKDLESQIVSLKQQIAVQDIKRNQDQDRKDARIATLENENCLLKQQLSGINSALYALPTSFQYGINSDGDNQTFLLQQRVNELTHQSKKLKDDLKEANRLLENSKKHNEQLSISNDSKNEEIANLRIERDEFEGKYNTTFSQIEVYKTKLQKLQNSFQDATNQNKQSKAAAINLEKICESQKNELSRALSDRNSLVSMTYKLKSLVQKEENIIDDLQSEKKKLKKKLKSMKCKTPNNSSNPSGSNDIPITSWYCQEFDEELCHKISEYASNEGFPASSKLKRVLSTIAKHYNDKLSKSKDESAENTKKHEQFISQLNDFLEPVGKQLSIPDFNTEALNNPMTVCQFRQNLSSAINEVHHYQETTDNYKSILSELGEMLNVSYDSIPQEVQSLKENCESFQNELKSITNKYKVERKENLINKKKLDQLKEKHGNALKAKDLSISKLKAKNDELEGHIKNTQEDFANLNRTMTESQQEKNQEHLTVLEQIKELQERMDKSNDKSIKEIEALKGEIQNKEKIIRRLEDDVNFWKQNSAAIKASHFQQDEEIQQVHENYRRLQDESHQQYEREKEALSKQYETVCNSLKKKNQELRDLIEQISASSNKYQRTISKLKAENTHLIHEKEKIQQNLDFQRDENARQKQIDQQKMKAYEMTNDTKVQSQIAEMKNKFIQDKKKYFNYAVKVFHNYYDGTKNIDEKTFKNTLSSAGDALKKLSQQDAAVRRLLGITDSESVESFISNMLLTLYHQH